MLVWRRATSLPAAWHLRSMSLCGTLGEGESLQTATEEATVQGSPLLLMHSLQSWLQQCMPNRPGTCLELSDGSACLYLEDVTPVCFLSNVAGWRG